MNRENINDPKELVDRLNKFQNHFVFRGHSNSNWKLETSLQRLLKQDYISKVAKCEKYSIDEFKSKFYLYNSGDYEPKTYLEWLAMMQHYGTPTRLLDFTESPFIALYFCLENAAKDQDEEMVIYAVDYRAINKATIDYFKNHDSDFKYDYADIEYSKDSIFDEYIKRFNEPLLWVTEPKRLNKRIEKQRGTFLYTNCNDKSYSEILETNIYKHVETYELEFPAKYWDHYYTILNKMNINGKTVYGDLDGLSKQIKMFIQAYGKS